MTDALERARALSSLYEREVAGLLPPGADIFDAHLHLGHDIDGMVGDYDELEVLMREHRVSRAFVFCGTRRSAPPTIGRSRSPSAPMDDSSRSSGST
jgi:hypothetical protein